MTFLGFPVETAALIAEWLLIGGGIAIAFLAGLVSHLNGRVKLIEALRTETAIADANDRAGTANQLAGEANERAGTANKDAAAANERAATASALAESFRLDIAQANERAAAANETAEKERRARLQLEARLADRVITEAQRTRLTAAFAPLKGQTVDVGMFGDNLDIANVNGAILRCLEAAGVRIQTFSPLGGGGGVRGVLFAVDPNASAAIKAAVQSAVSILRETLGAGVGLLDFAQLRFDGSAMTGNSDGAGPRGSGPARIWIGPK